MWDTALELIRVSIFASAHSLGGSVGAGILAVSTLLRLALMPLSLRSARHARAQQAIVAKLAPEIVALKRRYGNDRQGLAVATYELQRAHGVNPMHPSTLWSMLVQLPVFGALFAVLRQGVGVRTPFVWIADLSRPDALLVGIVAALSGAAAWLTPTPVGAPVTSRVLTIVAVLLTGVLFWSASSAVTLSVAAGAVTQALQNWLLKREDARRAGVAS
jgi:YidC/Oxa1 family membrane protein insertase